MIEDDLIAQWDERLIRALAAFDPRLFADAAYSLVGAGGGVSLSLFAGVDPKPGEHAAPTAEEAAKESHFLCCGSERDSRRRKRRDVLGSVCGCRKTRLERPETVPSVIALPLQTRNQGLLAGDCFQGLVRDAHGAAGSSGQ